MGLHGDGCGILRNYNWGGVVHVAAQELILCAVDDSLSGGSFADDVSFGHECVPVQLAGMSDRVFAREGVLPRFGRRERDQAGRALRAGSDLLVRESGFSSTLYRGFCDGAEGAVLGLPGARVRV